MAYCFCMSKRVDGTSTDISQRPVKPRVAIAAGVLAGGLFADVLLGACTGSGNPAANCVVGYTGGVCASSTRTIEASSTPAPSEATTTPAAPTTSEAPVTTTDSSPSRTPPPTPSPTPTTTSASSSTSEAPASRMTFTISCDADPGYCAPDRGAPITNAPFLGAYALNANVNGDPSTGVKYPHDNDQDALTPLCRGTGKFTNWIMVLTDPSWAEPNNSGQGQQYSGYIESAVVPGAAAAVGDCTGQQDYSGNFN